MIRSYGASILCNVLIREYACPLRYCPKFLLVSKTRILVPFATCTSPSLPAIEILFKVAFCGQDRVRYYCMQH